jgi:choline-glycine betaine transporter
LAGGLDALSNVVTTTGLPFLIILAFMCYSLFKGLREESEKVKPLTAVESTSLRQDGDSSEVDQATPVAAGEDGGAPRQPSH